MSAAPLETVRSFLAEALAHYLETAAVPPAEAHSRTLPQLGVDSMGAIALQYRIHQRFGLMVPVQALLSAPSLSSIGDLVHAGCAQARGPAPAGAADIGEVSL